MVAVVLLGAGASYGSGDVIPCVPPLGKSLFSELEKAGGIFTRIPDEIKVVFHQDFEKGMTAYQKYRNGDVTQFQRELANYFVKFTPGRSNYYLKLIGHLGVHRVIYSSLNYDLLFELSAMMRGFNVHYGVERKAAIRLLKPHGSCNFWPNTKGILKGCSFEPGQNASAEIDAPIRILNPEEVKVWCAEEDSLAPAMAIFAEGKAVRVSPGFIQAQQYQWAKAVNKANKIFVVGVRVHAIDEHIWGELGKTDAAITYFGGPNDRPEFEDWKSSSKKTNAHFMEAYFYESISIIQTML